MICCSVRSSLENSWRLCQFKSFLEYNLNIKGETNLAADIGNSAHLSMELRSYQKKAIQEGKDGFYIDHFGWIPLDQCNIDSFINMAFNHYKNTTPHNWTDVEYQLCREYVYTAITYNDGVFDPINQEIIHPELHFDIEVEKPWAKYKYEFPNGEVLEGNLHIMGTADLITRLGPNLIGFCDYKTGQRKDWATGEQKTPEKLLEDFQLQLYFYALSQLFPNDDIMVTIFYLKKGQGGPFCPPIDRSHLPKIEQKIKDLFEEIKNTKLPDLTPKPPWGPDTPNWESNYKCTKGFCQFGTGYGAKTLAPNGKSWCEYYYKELKKKGLEEMILEHNSLDNLSKYGSGAGRKRDDK